MLDRPPGRLVTSSYVFDETVTLTQARLGHRRGVAVGRILLDRTVMELLSILPTDERASWLRFEKRPDESYSFMDCTSFVLMRREKIGTAAALVSTSPRKGSSSSRRPSRKHRASPTGPASCSWGRS